MTEPCEHSRHAGHSVFSMCPPDDGPCPRSGAPHAGPPVRVAERVGERVHPLEVLDLVARLGDQQPDLDQREHDAAEVLRPGDAPVRQHGLGQQAELIPGEVAAGPGELGAAHVTPDLQTGLQILDGGEHEQEPALVVGSTSRADARENVIGELQLVHAVDSSGALAVRRTRPAALAAAYNGMIEVSTATTAFTRARVLSSGWVRARSISSATRTISAVPMPRVVSAGVPSRMPLVTNGDCGSSGIVFLLTVMPAWSSVFSEALPVKFLGRRSTSIRWVSVPPETIAKPRSTSAAARAFALSTT